MRTMQRAISLNRRSSRSGISIRTRTGWFFMIRVQLLICVCSVYSITRYFGWLSSAPDAVHVHQELDIGLGFTQGYEIWVFDSGTFSRAGDGGFINWAFGGCFTANGADVTFTQCWRRQLKIWVCGNQETFTIPINFKVFFYLFYVPQSFIVAAHVCASPQLPVWMFFFFCWYGVSFTREGLELFELTS